MDAHPVVLFDGQPGLAFQQGEDRTIGITLADANTGLPINLTGGIAGINFPLQGGGSIKRTTGTVGVKASQVNVSPSSSVSLTDHGFVNGDTVQVAAQGGGSLPAGLSALTNYLIQVSDANTFQFTDTSGNLISLTTQGSVGFNITNSNDLVLVSGDLGQITLNLRALVSAVVNAALAQSFQFEYTLGGKTRVIYISNLLDVQAQPVP